MSLPNILTSIRLAFAPVFVLVYMLTMRYFSGNEAAILLVLMLVLAAVELTDYFDGYFARKLGLVSDVGKLFDPFADATLHLSIFFCFASTGYMPPVCFLVIFYREFGMIFLRMMTIKRGVAIAARPGGKLKTVLYVVSCFWTLAYLTYVYSSWHFVPKTLPINIVGAGLFYVCALAALVSFIDYIIHFAIGMKKG
jgi:CDP-diacylglycerol--glycerol-3-phosphate 3-phosphatidyltransferase